MQYLVKKIKFCIPILCSFIFFALTGCQSLAPLHLNDKQKEASRVYVFPKLEHIKIEGRTDVLIRNGESNYSVIVTAEPAVLDQCTIKFDTNSFAINAPFPNDYSATKVIITVPGLKLDDLVLKNGVYIETADLNIDQLTLIAGNNSDISVRGHVFAERTNISKLGNGKLIVEWLDSASVVANNNGQGLVKLTGVAKNLSANIAGVAYLDVKYLRTDRLKITAQDTAYADVTALESLTAIAKDQSNVYYYQRPTALSITATQHSNVLYQKQLAPLNDKTIW